MPHPLVRCTLPSALLCIALPAAAQLEPVVVTATRSPVAALDYPGSATRLDGDLVRALGVVHSSELLNRAPGSFLQRGSGQEVLVAIRSPVLTGAGACGAFLVLEDGVPIRPVGFCNVNQLFEVNLEQAGVVELLRGPGIGVLGANAVHGVVNVLPARAVDLPPLGVGVEVGSADWRRVRLAGRVLGERTRSAFAAHHTRDGGFRADSGFEETKANAALEHDLGAGTLRLALAATRLDQDTAGFVLGRDAYRDPGLRRSNPNPEAFRAAEAQRAIAEYRADGGLEARLYARRSRMEFLQHFLLGQPLERNGQQSLGLLVGTGGERGTLGWRAGLDLELARGWLVQFQDGPTTGGTALANAIRPPGLQYDYAVDARLAAPWLQLDWRFATAWTASAALRAEHVHYDYDNRMLAGNTAVDGTPCPFGGCLYARPADRRDTFEELAPRLGVSWRYAPRHAAWASLARGFRPPEATELYRLQRQQSVASLDAERVDSAELGLRGDPGAWRYELAAFAMDKRNLILRDANGFNVDDGRTRHLGLEFDLAWTPLARLTLGATGTLARHTYRFDRAIEGGETIASGDDVDTAPRRLGTLRAEWRPSDATRLELEWLSVGPYWADAANRQRYPGHSLLNLRAGADLGRGFALRARVLNLADRAYADRADFAFGNWRYFPGRGRSWFLEIGYAAPGSE